MTIRIGLTGPIGCGKSTVAGWLGAAGARVVDADAVARDVSAPGTPVAAAIAEAFGPGVQGPDRVIDRAALARVVFADPAALARLEAIVHPAVRPAILAAIATAEADGAPAVVIEAIRLVEGGLADLCESVWLVVCAPADQATRLTGRGMPADEAGRRIAAQVGLVERVRPRATRTLDTSGPAAEVQARVLAAYDADVAGTPGD